MSKLLVIEPAEAENLDTNPSIEDPTNGLADITAVGSTETRELTQARFGRASVQIVTDGVAVGEGIRKDSAPGISAQPVTASCYLRGDGWVRLRLVDNTNGLTFTGKPFALLNEYWTRASVVGFLGALAVTDLRLFVETAERIQSVTFWVDAFQVEATGWPTSYADGDMERELPPHAGDAFFRWTGARQASTSVRSGRFRRGGRLRELSQGLDFLLWPTQSSGLGMPPVQLNVQNFADVDRALVQRVRPLPRALGLTFWASKDPDERVGSPADLGPLHKARRALEEIVKPDLVQETQSLLLRYLNAGAPRDLEAVYEGGLEWSGDLRFPFNNSFAVRLFCPDPFWRVDSQDVLELDPGQTVANANRIVARINGEWQAIGTGANNQVRVIEVDPRTGDVYVGGSFTSFDGDANCARICRISRDGQTITPLATGVDDNVVFAIAFGPDGMVYVGGTFLAIGGVTMNRIARYDPGTDTWATMGTGAPVGFDDDVQGLAVDRNGILFLGGALVQTADTLTTLNKIASWDPATNAFSALTGAFGVGVNDTVHEITMDLDGETVFFCGNFTQETGAGANTLKRVAKWDGAAFTQLGEEGADQRVRHIELAPNGNLYAVGEGLTDIGFVTVQKVAVFNRQEWFPLGVEGDGLLGGTVARWIGFSPKGLAVFGGDFTSATRAGLAAALASWDGTRFGHLDVVLPGTPTVHSLAFNGDDLWVGGDFNGSAEASEIQTAENNGRAKASPILEVLGPAHLRWLENQTTGQRVLFDLEILDGETVLVDLRQGLQRATSDFRGNVIAGVLPGSDLLELLPGSNRIAFMAEDTDTPTEISLRWQVTHWSFDD